NETQAQFAHGEIESPNAWHLKVAESEAEYDFTDGVSVQKAVESSKKAPNEYISTFQIHKDKYVLRLIFANDLDHAKAAQAIKRTRLVFPLILKLVSETK
ncbi:MAG: hypothetical protein ACREBV_03240, partial [Candidatus Zixiibacteriota bacterium]